MYNGIGLQTARGSGTNGFVMRNLSYIPDTKNKPHYRTEEELKKLDIDAQKEPNPEILEHARKRALEVKCLEMSEVLQDAGYEESEIEERVKDFREMLMERENRAKDKLLLEFGTGNCKETHATAAAQQQKNARLKKAFGISEYFIEGSSLDPDRKAKEDAVRRLREEEDDSKRSQTHTYKWVSSPSPERESSSTKKDKKKKSKRRRERSSSPESRKKRKSKKSKRSSSSRSPKKKKHSREKKSKKRHRNSPKSRSRSIESGSNKAASRKDKAGNGSGNDRRESTDKVKSSPKDKKRKKHRGKGSSKSIYVLRKSLSPDPDLEIYKETIYKDKTPQTSMSNIKDTPVLDKLRERIIPTSSSPNIITSNSNNTASISEVFDVSTYNPVESTNRPLQILLPPSASTYNSANANSQHSFYFKNILNIQKTTSQLKLPVLKETSSMPAVSPFKIARIADKIGFRSQPLPSSPAEFQDSVNTLELKTKSSSQSIALKLPNKIDYSEPIPTEKLNMTSTNTLEPSPKRVSRQSRSRRQRESSESSRSRSRSYTKSSSRSRSYSRSRSRSSHSKCSLRSSISGYRSMSFSKSRSRTRSRTHSKSRTRSWTRSRSCSDRSSRSASYVSRTRSRSISIARSNRSSVSPARYKRSNTRSISSRSRSVTPNSPTKQRSKSRSPSIPRRKGSPSFLDKRRITSARKRPVPYYRPSPPPSPSSSETSWWSRSLSRSRSRSWSRTRSPS